MSVHIGKVESTDPSGHGAVVFIPPEDLSSRPMRIRINPSFFFGQVSTPCPSFEKGILFDEKVREQQVPTVDVGDQIVLVENHKHPGVAKAWGLHALLMVDPRLNLEPLSEEEEKTGQKVYAAKPSRGNKKPERLNSGGHRRGHRQHTHGYA